MDRPARSLKCAVVDVRKSWWEDLDGRQAKQVERKRSRAKASQRPGTRTSKQHTRAFRWQWRRGSPVPIPNTEVKPFSADGTWLETARESRSPPVSNITPQLGSFFMDFSVFWVLSNQVRNFGLRLPCHAACLSSDLSESSLRYPLVTDHSSEYSIRYTVTSRR